MLTQPWVMLMQGCILLMQGCVRLTQGCIEYRQACVAVSQVHQHASSAIQSLLARQSFSAIKGAVSVSVLSPLASEGGRQGESCTRRDGRAGLPSGCCILWPAMEGGCYQMDRTELLLDLRHSSSSWLICSRVRNVSSVWSVLICRILASGFTPVQAPKRISSENTAER